jgi:hypothetical protein
MQQLEVDVALANALTGRGGNGGVGNGIFPEPPSTMPGTPALRTLESQNRSRSGTVRGDTVRSWREGDDSELGELNGGGR